jgi:hypothetical protein
VNGEGAEGRPERPSTPSPFTIHALKPLREAS